MRLPALIAFDLDDTLAPSKSALDPAMVDVLLRLLDRTEVCIISGGAYTQFQNQVLGPLAARIEADVATSAARLERLHLMPTCGTQYYRHETGEWRRHYAETLTDHEVNRAIEALEAHARRLGFWATQTWGPVIENRHSQVTFSALGQAAPVNVKTAWDPDGSKKSTLRAAVAVDLPDLEVRSGGSTSIDITRRGIDKAYGMRKLRDATGIEFDDMLFVGDRLDEGGNDFPVIALGVPTKAVDGWHDTVAYLEELLTLDPVDRKAPMKISVIGCGYLGAVHASAMAELGHEVVGIDVDERKITELTAGRPPFFEPGLPEILTSAIASGRLRFSTAMADAAGAEIHFIAVGTPQTAGSDAADMRYVDAAFDGIAPYLAEGALVVGKSTVPVGTAARLAARLAEIAPHARLAWNPEFLREGYAVKDTVAPDRLVYGVADEQAVEQLDAVYRAALDAGTPRIVTDYATAELVKVAANAFLATKISFINAMAEIAEVTGADVTQLADAIGHDARIGRRFLNAGVGFGGGCLPKDIRAFAARAEELGRGDSVGFLREVDEINMRRRQRVVDLAIEALGGSVYRKRIAVLGVTFKPESDDVRDSPALDVAVQLKGLGADVVATDPEGIDNARGRHPQLDYDASTEDALRDADLVVLVTEWREYRGLDPVATASLVGTPSIIDGRNVLDPVAWRAAGWTYRGLGRP